MELVTRLSIVMHALLDGLALRSFQSSFSLQGHERGVQRIWQDGRSDITSRFDLVALTSLALALKASRQSYRYYWYAPSTPLSRTQGRWHQHLESARNASEQI